MRARRGPRAPRDGASRPEGAPRSRRRKGGARARDARGASAVPPELDARMCTVRFSARHGRPAPEEVVEALARCGELRSADEAAAGDAVTAVFAEPAGAAAAARLTQAAGYPVVVMRGDAGASPPSPVLVVKNLPYGAERAAIAAHVLATANVATHGVRLRASDERLGRSTNGIAFAHFASVADAAQALPLLSGTLFGERVLRVEFKRGAGGGGGGVAGAVGAVGAAGPAGPAMGTAPAPAPAPTPAPAPVAQQQQPPPPLPPPPGFGLPAFDFASFEAAVPEPTAAVAAAAPAAAAEPDAAPGAGSGSGSSDDAAGDGDDDAAGAGPGVRQVAVPHQISQIWASTAVPNCAS